MRPSIAASVVLRGQRLDDGIERRLRVLDHQQSRRAERRHAVANFRADRSAATGNDDGLVLHQCFKTRVIDLFARTQQQIFDGKPPSAAAHRRSPAMEGG